MNQFNCRCPHCNANLSFHAQDHERGHEIRLTCEECGNHFDVSVPKRGLLLSSFSNAVKGLWYYIVLILVVLAIGTYILPLMGIENNRFNLYKSDANDKTIVLPQNLDTPTNQQPVISKPKDVTETIEKSIVYVRYLATVAIDDKIGEWERLGCIDRRIILQC